MKKDRYVEPMMQEFMAVSEGILCSSPGGGAGDLNDNSWQLDAVDEIDYDN